MLAEEAAEAPAFAARPRRVALPGEEIDPLGPAIYVDGGGKTAPAEYGLLYAAVKARERIGFFRTVADVCDEGTDEASRLASRNHDRKITLMRDVFDLDDVPREAMYGVTRDEALRLLANNEEDRLVEKILTKYLAYAADRDFVLVSRPVENVLSSGSRLELSAKLCEARRAARVEEGTRST